MRGSDIRMSVRVLTDYGSEKLDNPIVFGCKSCLGSPPIKDRRMQYRHLYYFLKIVEAGSFSQAARTVHVAQPALSQQIAELEASLGVPLLQRSARGVKPTAVGDILYEEASSILRKYDKAGLVRSSAGDVVGRVSLGMPASLSTTLVGWAIHRTVQGGPSKDHPQVHRRGQRIPSRGSREEPAGFSPRL
jgi:molybdenum-dependent DNA-binding transcriptional regulator ModE